MKQLYALFSLLLLLSVPALGQSKVDSYKASNGITYQVGDTVKLGRGSAPNGDFLYLQMGGWGAAMSYDASAGSDQFNVGRSYSGLAVVVKKIKKHKFKGQEKTVFTVGGGNITNYNLLIEDAIATCEVAACKEEAVPQAAAAAPGKYDKLKQLKELLDSGVISQEEFDKEKAKVLSEN